MRRLRWVCFAMLVTPAWMRPAAPIAQAAAAMRAAGGFPNRGDVLCFGQIGNLLHTAAHTAYATTAVPAAGDAQTPLLRLPPARRGKRPH